MRLYREEILQADGTTKLSDKWYVEWSDHEGKVRRWAAFSDKRLSEEFGRNLERFAAAVSVAGRVDQDIIDWVGRLSDRQRSRLQRIGLLDAAGMRAGKIMSHLEQYHAWLDSQELVDQHVSQVIRRITRYLNDTGTRRVGDITPQSVTEWLSSLRNAGSSIATSNRHLTSVKSWVRWMHRDKRIHENPIAYMKPLNEATDVRHERTVFTTEELLDLIEGTTKAPARWGMSGTERSWLYRLAAETGLRRAELASVRPADFRWTDEPSVTVRAGYAKNRRQDTIPLSVATARELRRWLGTNYPAASPIWHVPQKSSIMLRSDMAFVRADWIAAAEGTERMRRQESTYLQPRDDAGRIRDFHSFRHTFITAIGSRAESIRDMMALARHCKPELTMRYAHPRLTAMRAAVEGLYSTAARGKKRKKSG